MDRFFDTDSTRINSAKKNNSGESHVRKKLSLFAMVKATQIIIFLDLFH